ncbi:MAG: hypothetical protein ACE5KL_08300 [Alphaproteobacteria bacterium]
MSRNLLNGAFGALLAGLLVIFPAASSAGHLERSQVVDGMVVYLGIMAAEVLREHPDQYPEHQHQMHGGIPPGKDMYHVLVTLFDGSSGERITDADVEARVSPLGLAGPIKHLHPMSTAGAVCYCDYFELSPTDTYVIRLQIRRPGVPGVIEAEFLHRPHSECCQ